MLLVKTCQLEPIVLVVRWQGEEVDVDRDDMELRHGSSRAVRGHGTGAYLPP